MGFGPNKKEFLIIFQGINFNVLNKLEDKDLDPKEYLDGWVCTSIFFRNCEIKKYSIVNRAISLCHYLKY